MIFGKKIIINLINILKMKYLIEKIDINFNNYIKLLLVIKLFLYLINYDNTYNYIYINLSSILNK